MITTFKNDHTNLSNKQKLKITEMKIVLTDNQKEIINYWRQFRFATYSYRVYIDTPETILSKSFMLDNLEKKGLCAALDNQLYELTDLGKTLEL